MHNAEWGILHFPAKAPESMEGSAAALSPGHLVISKNGKVLVFWAFKWLGQSLKKELISRKVHCG